MNKLIYKAGGEGDKPPMTMKPLSRRYNWTNVVFFTVTPLIALVSTVWIAASGALHPATVGLAVLMLAATGFGITGGYHRLFSHRTYQASWPVRLFYLLFGAAAFQGSVRWWSMGHRHHHRFGDSEEDPYGIHKGFWYAHIGWLFARHDEGDVYDNVRDLDQDVMVRLQDRYYLPVAIAICFAFPVALASLWGDPWGGLFIAGFTRMVLMHHGTFCINSLCHYVGRQTYSDRHSARDSWISAIFTYGEGYHNFHHEFQTDYRNGLRAWQWDPTKWLIGFLEKVGLAWNLHRVEWQRILQAKMMMDQKKFVARLSSAPASARMKVEPLLVSTKDRLQQAQVRFFELKNEYGRIRREKVDFVAHRIDEIREELQKAKQDFRRAMAEWRSLIEGSLPV